jgi:dipeptidyl aminopeptidase/acylaminoacyl peptidase
MNKKRKIRLRVILVLIGSGFLFIHYYVPKFITEIKNPLIQIFRKDNLFTANRRFENNHLNGKYINFKSFDSIQIAGYITYSELVPAKGTIILLHGIRSKKEHSIDLSNRLAQFGYNSVAIDSRAHGESGGIHCTFGVKEKQDISKLIQVLSDQENITKNIGIWGQSLGGAIGLQAIGSDKRIKFGIIESTFTDFKTITNDYFSYHVGFNIRPFTNYLVDRAGAIAGFDPKDASPIKYCEKIEQPILLIHGNKDDRIDIRYAKANFSKIRSTRKEFIEIDQANHLNVWEVGGEEYFKRIMMFIEANSR